MGPLTVDASVMIRAVTPPEPGHEECAELMARIGVVRRPVILPTLALVELVAGMSRRAVPKPVVADLLDRVRSLPALTLVPLDLALMEESMEVAASNKARASDVVYMAVARRYDAILVTVDEQQRVRVPDGLKAASPTQVLAELETRRLPNTP